MLEGAVTTRRDAKKLLRSGRKPKTNGERMVVNNYHAILFIREHRKTPLSKEFLLELQSILTKDTLDQEDAVGRFRHEQENVRIAVNQSLISGECALAAGDEVAFLPPVTGG